MVMQKPLFLCHSQQHDHDLLTRAPHTHKNHLAKSYPAAFWGSVAGGRKGKHAIIRVIAGKREEVASSAFKTILR